MIFKEVIISLYCRYEFVHGPVFDANYVTFAPRPYRSRLLLTDTGKEWNLLCPASADLKSEDMKVSFETNVSFGMKDTRPARQTATQNLTPRQQLIMKDASDIIRHIVQQHRHRNSFYVLTDEDLEILVRVDPVPSVDDMMNGKALPFTPVLSQGASDRRYFVEAMQKVFETHTEHTCEYFFPRKKTICAHKASLFAEMKNGKKVLWESQYSIQSLCEDDGEKGYRVKTST